MVKRDSNQQDQRTDESPCLDFHHAPLGQLGRHSGQPIDVVSIACSKWRPLTVGLLAGVLFGLCVYSYLGPYYQTDARIMVSQRSTLPTDEHSPKLSGDRADHVHLIMSDAIVQRALTDHGLSDLDAFAISNDATHDIIDALEVTRTAGNDDSLVNLIDISYSHGDKATSRAVVEAVLAAYDADLLKSRQEISSGLLDSLLSRQLEIEQEISKLREFYQLFRDTSPFDPSLAPVLSPDGDVIPGPGLYQTRVENIRTDQSRNRASQSEIRSRMATLAELREGRGSRDALESSVRHSKTAGAAESSGQNAGFDKDLSTVTEQEEPQGEVDIVAGYAQSLENELLYLEDRELRLADDLVVAQEEANDAALFAVQDQEQRDDIARQEQHLHNIVARIESIGLRADQEGDRMRQIADVRVQTSVARVIKILGTCGVLGIAVAFGLACFREWRDNTLRTPDELREFLPASVRGQAPHFKTVNARKMSASGIDVGRC